MLIDHREALGMRTVERLVLVGKGFLEGPSNRDYGSSFNFFLVLSDAKQIV